MAAMASDSAPPTLTPTRTGVGWRLPALAVAVALVALVGLTRLGAPDRPIPSDVPLPVAQASPTASPAPTRGPAVPNRLDGVIARSADGLTYVDGIPTGISGQAVYRVRDALLVPLGRTLLVGGWSDGQGCAAITVTGCSPPRLTDGTPFHSRQTALPADVIAMDSRLTGFGRFIVLATVEDDPRCSIVTEDACQPRLHVVQPIWWISGSLELKLAECESEPSRCNRGRT
jgi:hypothetical protein